MSAKSKYEYFRVLIERYQKLSSKIDRGKVIDEACLNTGLHRKSVIRALSQAASKNPFKTKPGRPKLYSDNAIFILKKLYKESEYQCSGKLRAMIESLLSQYKFELLPEVKREILAISPASIDRYLKKYRNIQTVKGLSTTRSGSRVFKKIIPLKNLSNIARLPGTLECDTVAHCAESTAGQYAVSLTITDEYSGWTNNNTAVNKCAKHVKPLMEATLRSLPFDLVSINVDNGSEFLNHLTYGFFKLYAKEKNILFPMTRSRSYQKNDNARVEQKNYTHVRQLFGYDRIEDQRLVDLMNKIYEVQNLIQNFFIPQYKLQYKVRIEGKIKKKYDKPKTPYQRLLESNIPETNKEKLRAQYATLCYPDLKQKKEALLADFLKLQKQIELEKRASSTNPNSAQFR